MLYLDEKQKIRFEQEGRPYYIGAIELTRRLTGWVIPCLIIISITYVGWWGSMISGVFSFPGLSWESIFFRSIYGDDAMFGTIARISSTFVFLFIMFELKTPGVGLFALTTVTISRAPAPPEVVTRSESIAAISSSVK